MTDRPGPDSVATYLKNVSNTPYVNLQDSTGGPFAARLGKSDAEDRKWAIRKSLINQGQTDAGMAIAPESFFDYLDRKDKMALQMEFESWVMANAKLDTPESRQFWYNMNPWMKEKQLELLEEQSELQKRMAKININGPTNPEDMFFIFAIQNGLIHVADTPLYKLTSEGDSEGKARSKSYKAGLFSPWSEFFLSKGIKNMSSPGVNGVAQARQIDYNNPWTAAPTSKPTGLTHFIDKSFNATTGKFDTSKFMI